LHLYIELKGDVGNEDDLAASVKEQLALLDSSFAGFYNDFSGSIDFRVEVTLLPKGTFANYTAQRQAEGADLAHLKPPHINPPGKVLSLLLGSLEAEALAAG